MRGIWTARINAGRNITQGKIKGRPGRLKGDGMNTFKVYQGMDRKWYWQLRKNGRIIADGAEGYATKSNARRAIRLMVLAIEVQINRIID